MSQHAIGLHFADGQVWAALIGRRRKTLHPELLGWSVSARGEWQQLDAMPFGRQVARLQCSAARAMPVSAVFTSYAVAPPGAVVQSGEELLAACRQELKCGEILLSDAAVATDRQGVFVALAKQAAVSELRRECGQAESLLQVVALELPALFGLLTLTRAPAAQGRVVLVHTEPNRRLVGLFAGGAPLRLAEWPADSSWEGVREWLEAGDWGQFTETSKIVVSGVVSQRDVAAQLSRHDERIAGWEPLQVIASAVQAPLREAPGLAIAAALAVSALDPGATSCINFMRNEASEVAMQRRRLGRWRNFARAAVWTSLVMCAGLLADASWYRLERSGVAAQQAHALEAMAIEQAGSRMRRADELAAQELRSPDFAPLASATTLRPLLAIVPPETKVMSMHLLPGSIEIRGVADGAGVAQLAAQAFPGASVEVDRAGGFSVRVLLNAAEGINHE